MNYGSGSSSFDSEQDHSPHQQGHFFLISMEDCVPFQEASRDQLDMECLPTKLQISTELLPDA